MITCLPVRGSLPSPPLGPQTGGEDFLGPLLFPAEQETEKEAAAWGGLDTACVWRPDLDVSSDQLCDLLSLTFVSIK